jgi:hypothetical protein
MHGERWTNPRIVAFPTALPHRFMCSQSRRIQTCQGIPKLSTITRSLQMPRSIIRARECDLLLSTQSWLPPCRRWSLCGNRIPMSLPRPDEESHQASAIYWLHTCRMLHSSACHRRDSAREMASEILEDFAMPFYGIQDIHSGRICTFRCGTPRQRSAVRSWLP